jgi:hypothetical protein
MRDGGGGGGRGDVGSGDSTGSTRPKTGKAAKGRGRELVGGGDELDRRRVVA